MAKPRYLTKSRFKLALKCPTRLYYTGKPLYPDKSIDDPFLLALADGGFQVGELAKHYHAGGREIRSLDYEESEHETKSLLERDEAIIYEAAIRHGSLLVRIDILKKQGNRLDLIEVKSKSFDSEEEDLPFFTKKGDLVSCWRPYLYDIAYQAFVLTKAMPNYEVRSSLMIVDKAVKCPTDGLNQKFRVKKNYNNRKYVVVNPNLSAQDLSVRLLKTLPVDDCVDMIWKGKGTDDFAPKGFEGTIAWLAESYEKDEKIPPSPGKECRDCTFICSEEELREGLKSGFRECWKEAFGWRDSDFREQSVLDLWNYRRKDEAIQSGKLKLVQLSEDDLRVKDDGKPGLSTTQRQLMQIVKDRTGDTERFFDRDNMAAEMKRWTFPLHFIDFETAISPIPFTRGCAPYEMIAFQYSHHNVEPNGTVRHAGEYLCAEPGVFPNFRFLRALKKELEQDQGTIFRYSNHENAVLLSIYEQLASTGNPPEDRDELQAFIVSITNGSGKKGLS